jgi:hypothetical protein
VAEGRGGVVKKFLGHTTPSARADSPYAKDNLTFERTLKYR